MYYATIIYDEDGMYDHLTATTTYNPKENYDVAFATAFDLYTFHLDMLKAAE